MADTNEKGLAEGSMVLSRCHPARLLRNCHKVLLQGVETEADEITKDFAVQVLDAAVDDAIGGDSGTGQNFGGFED